MQFRDLKIGETFDWINPDPAKSTQNSFFRPCMKISARKYRTIGGGPITEYVVGKVSADVFHVNEHGE